MIDKDHMMAVVLDACPSFTPEWEAFLEEWKDEDDLPLIPLMCDFARLLIAMYERGDTDHLSRIFEAIERLHVEGDDYVQAVVTTGILEGLQNLHLHTNTQPEQFRPFLGPVSARCWDDLAAMWEQFFRDQERARG